MPARPDPRSDPATRRYHGPSGPAVRLPKGDVTEGVLRIGDTVRRPHQPQSPAVAAYLDHLAAVGFEIAPRYLGRDEHGQDVLSFLPGDVAGDPPEPWAAADELLVDVGRMLARLHQASAGFGADTGFAPPAGSVWARQLVQVPGAEPDPLPELVSHNDVTPQNVVVRGGRVVGLVDFDLAGPTTRLRDAWNTAMHWVPLRPPTDIWSTWAGIDQPRRLRLFADGYRMNWQQRQSLIEQGISGADQSWLRMRAAAEQLGGGWARMWAAGVGDAIRRRQRWLLANRDQLTAALLAGYPR